MSARDDAVAIRAWREFAKDPERVEDLRRHAMDLLSDHFDNIVDGDIGLLSPAARERYLLELTDSLAANIMRALGGWVLSDFVLPDEWLQRQSDEDKWLAQS